MCSELEKSAETISSPASGSSCRIIFPVAQMFPLVMDEIIVPLSEGVGIQHAQGDHQYYAVRCPLFLLSHVDIHLGCASSCRGTRHKLDYCTLLIITVEHVQARRLQEVKKSGDRSGCKRRIRITNRNSLSQGSYTDLHEDTYRISGFGKSGLDLSSMDRILSLLTF